MTDGTEAFRLPTRRQALGALAGAAGAGLVPGGGLAADGAALHDYAAQTARRLAAGRAITLSILIPNGSNDNVRPVIAAFELATGIKVVASETPVDEISAELALDTMTGEGQYDLALPPTFGLPDLVASGAIVPLTEFARRHEPEGFRDGVLYQIGDSFDGQIYGFQADGDTYVMFYNKDFAEDPDERARYADRYGTPLATPATWEELDRQIAFFNRPDDGMFGGLLFRTPGYLAWEWWVRFHAKGIWPLSPTLEPQIASDAGIEALAQMISVTAHLHPQVDRLNLFENWERFGRGDIYCNIGWGGSQKYLQGPASDLRDRMIHGPTPGGLVEGEVLYTPYFNWGWNYVVTSRSDEPEIPYLFALFASSSKMSALAVRQQSGYFDPFRAEHYQDPGIRAAYSDSFLDIHQASLRGSIPDLYLANQGEYFRVLSEWLDKALRGLVTPAEALRRVDQNWRLITDRSQPDLQRERWVNLRQKYPEQVRARLRDL